MTTNRLSGEGFPDVFIVGTGMVGTQQLTREAWTALELSSDVFVLHPQDPVKQYLEQELDAVVHSLSSLYEEKKERRETYEAVAAAVLEQSTSHSEPVSLAVYGHPTIGVSPATILQEVAPEYGIEIELLPGISSLDCIFTDLGLDPFYGLQMYESNELLIYEYDINEHIPLMIFQVGAVETGLHTSKQSDPNRFRRIKEYLLQYYPADHEVILIRCSTLPFTESDILRIQIGEIQSFSDHISKLHTLLVPEKERKEPVNERLLDESTSAEHLKNITE